MADISSQDAAVIAKEITLKAMDTVYRPDDATPENTGDQFGKLFKRILQHVREGMYEKKYD